MAKNYAFCSVSVAPLRRETSDSSELVSQLMFGETLEILAEENQWRKVKSLLDEYEGWTDEKLITSLPEPEMVSWQQEHTLLYNSTLLLHSVEGQMLLTKGAFLPKSMMNFELGGSAYHMTEQLDQRPSEILEIAKSYLNAPYLWGGKTMFGIDCSGFTQMVFRFLNKKLPRDASQQAKEGTLIPMDEIQEGDLAFFQKPNGQIHHVGILLSKSLIIHSHGTVRVDDFDAKGIRHRKLNGYSHQFAFVKRIE